MYEHTLNLLLFHQNIGIAFSLLRPRQRSLESQCSPKSATLVCQRKVTQSPVIYADNTVQSIHFQENIW